MSSPSPYRVTFVCSGNICRSPIAEYVLADALERAGLADTVQVESAGTGDWHIGEHADPRALAALHLVGLDATAHRARLLDPEAFASADLVIALDAGHLRDLRSLVTSPAGAGRIHLLRSFDARPGKDQDVADPFYGGDDDFARVIEQVQAAVPGLLQRIRSDLQARDRQAQGPHDQEAGSLHVTDP